MRTSMRNIIPMIIKCLKRETKIPFSEAIRSEIHVLDTTRKATASNCAPCLSSNVGTWKTTSLEVNKNISKKLVVVDKKKFHEKMML